VRQRFLDEAGPLGDATERLTELLAEESPLLGPAERARRARHLSTELVGLGPIQHLLDRPGVTDVLVNGPGPAWVECGGHLVQTDVVLDREGILRAIERLVAPLGLRADRSHPIVDGRLADGTRVTAVLQPLAVDGPLLAVRRHGSRLIGLEELAGPRVAELLGTLVRERHNIVVYGPTGAGKTTLVNALGAHVAPGERVVVIEDVAELRLPGDHVVRLETRPGTREGLGRVTMSDLVRAALRLRPDRIVVGEVRGVEAVDMVWALSTGHRGSMSTCHASDPADALRRLETMIVLGLGEGVPLAAVREQVLAAVDVLVGVGRVEDGTRRVTAVHLRGRDGLRRLDGPEPAIHTPARSATVGPAIGPGLPEGVGPKAVRS